MSILGAVLRTHPEQLPQVLARLKELPGVDIALNPGDGRLVLVMEDTVDPEGQTFAAATMLADMAMWPNVLSTSLVYEYSGPDAPALGEGDMSDYRRWRGKPGDRTPAAATATAATTDFFANPVPHGTDRELFP
ncbi:MAG: chaperone NapD [Betaproteobacteria bacterium]|nr:chaperone NapD [Betaproteobacteria bacterium]